MISIIFLVYFLFRGLNIIFYKYDIYKKFERFAINKNIFIYKMSTCKFCIDHHLSIISTFIVGLLEGFEWYFLILPIVSASIENLIYDRSKN